jgi:TolB protein
LLVHATVIRALALLAVSAAIGLAEGEERAAAQAGPIWADEQTNALGAPSPDGRHLSFVDSDGNLAIRDLETHTVRALTSSAGGPAPGQFAYFSIFSRDSRQVAFAWFNDEGFYELRVVALDGSAPRTLYRNPEAGFVQPTAFSPDGDQILTLLFRRDNVSQIAMVSASDGAARVLRSLDWFYPKKIDLSPDGRFIVYDSMPAGDSAARDIHILAVDGSGHGTLTHSPANDLFPLWTPDGKAVVFGSDRGGAMGAWKVRVDDGRAIGEPVLVKRDIGRALPMAFTSEGSLFYGLRSGRSDVFVGRFDASSGTLVVGAEAVSSGFAGGNRKPEWSPNGRHLAYLSRVGTENYGQEHRVITVRELASGQEASHAPRLAFIEQLKWSPDGGSLLLSGGDAQGRSGLFVLDLSNGETLQAVVERSGNFRGLEGDWSLDGRQILLARRTGPNRFAILAHDLDSGQEHQLYEPPAGRAVIRSVRRARSADRLAFVLEAGPDGAMQSVQVLDVGKAEATPVLHSQFGEISAVEWIENDESLLVSAEASGGSSLWAVSPSGADPARLDAPWKRPGAVRVSPDGNHIAFSHEESKAEVWALEIKPPTVSAR